MFNFLLFTLVYIALYNVMPIQICIMTLRWHSAFNADKKLRVQVFFFSFFFLQGRVCVCATTKLILMPERQYLESTANGLVGFGIKCVLGNSLKLKVREALLQQRRKFQFRLTWTRRLHHCVSKTLAYSVDGHDTS